MPRPMAELIRSADERQTLKTWASRPKSTQRLATRARIVLACAEGQGNKAVAAKLGVCSATVGTWRRRSHTTSGGSL
jgi:DNA-binding NarL/FixJ family response regulator